MAEFKPFEMIARIEYGGATYDGDAAHVCLKPTFIQPLVRCRDCKYRPHWDEKTSSAVFPIPDRCPCECDDYFYSWIPNDDWFCAEGERRSDG
jgi:hypothetical protein